MVGVPVVPKYYYELNLFKNINFHKYNYVLFINNTENMSTW